MREREKRDSRGDEREGQGRNRNRNESEETEGQALPSCKPISVGRPGDVRYRTSSPHPTYGKDLRCPNIKGKCGNIKRLGHVKKGLGGIHKSKGSDLQIILSCSIRPFGSFQYIVVSILFVSKQ